MGRVFPISNNSDSPRASHSCFTVVTGGVCAPQMHISVTLAHPWMFCCVPCAAQKRNGPNDLLRATESCSKKRSEWSGRVGIICVAPERRHQSGGTRAAFQSPFTPRGRGDGVRLQRQTIHVRLRLVQPASARIRPTAQTSSVHPKSQRAEHIQPRPAAHTRNPTQQKEKNLHLGFLWFVFSVFFVFVFILDSAPIVSADSRPSVFLRF